MKKCTVDTCMDECLAKGLCSFHYHRQRHGIALQVPRSFQPEVQCTVAECGKKHLAKGFCSFHYYRQKHGIELLVPLHTKTRRIKEQECAHDDLDHGVCIDCGEDRTEWMAMAAYDYYKNHD